MPINCVIPPPAMANAFALTSMKSAGFRHSRNYVFSISTTSKATVEMVRKQVMWNPEFIKQNTDISLLLA